MLKEWVVWKLSSKLIRVPNNHEITIKIPDEIPSNELAEVILILRNGDEGFKKKIEKLRGTLEDPLFREYVAAVSDDFSETDREGWE